MHDDDDQKASITQLQGVKAAQGTLGIKANGQPDAALFVVDRPSAYAGVFTTNQFKSACVESATDRLHAGKNIQAVLITSGNANAGTGLQGRADTEMLADAIATELGCQADEVIVLHTGVIGIALHADRLIGQIPRLVAGLATDAKAGVLAAKAMMTTDTVPKLVSHSFTYDGHTYTVAGVAKGAGMIHPCLATMLSVIITDAPVQAPVLQCALATSVATSFNAISVDGDTSPNDSVILLATGEGEVWTKDHPAFSSFQEALDTVTLELAQKIVRDGEGATKFLTVNVTGAQDDGVARRVAEVIVTSPLVKTAFYGEDFNPGRIVSAIGRSNVELVMKMIRVAIGETIVFEENAFLQVDGDEAKRVMAQKEIEIKIDLGQGVASCRYFTCDLTHEYVSINAEYTT